jgi:trehalose 6-phosphate synthase/phosphatase
MNIEHQQGDELVASLDLALLLPRYRHSQRRLVLVDFEDTLWQRNPRRRQEGQGEGIPLEAIEIVRRLSEDSRNEVWLLSGLPVKTLDAVAVQLPKVGFV